MHLNDRTDYGLRILILLGSASPERLSSREMADVYGISYSHVQKVVQSLEAAGFVDTYRGRGGGVSLARLPADITVGEVVRALEPHMDLVGCFRPGTSGCVLEGGCSLTRSLLRAKAAFLSELDDTTLSQIIDGSPALVQLSWS